MGMTVRLGHTVFCIRTDADLADAVTIRVHGRGNRRTQGWWCVTGAEVGSLTIEPLDPVAPAASGLRFTVDESESRCMRGAAWYSPRDPSPATGRRIAGGMGIWPHSTAIRQWS